MSGNGVFFVVSLLVRPRCPQELDFTSDGLAQLNLTAQLAFPEVHGGNMALPPGQQQLPPVAGVFAVVRPQVGQLQFESLLGRLYCGLALDVVLPYSVRPLQLCFRLEEPGRVLKEDLGVFGLGDGRLVLGLELLHVGAQLLVAHTAHVDAFASAIVAVRLFCAASPLLFFFGAELGTCILDLQGAVGLRRRGSWRLVVHGRACG